jgi:2-keto-4-pentenoate hydratase/2-oxohepta-3-ene-1,7-dioic acid hydratase in catechol pathway
VRTANLAGRLVLVTPDGTRALDVQRASAGRFAADPQAVYDQWPEFAAWAAGTDLSPAEPFAAEDLGAPAPAPRQVLAIGLNYAEHAAESGFDVPDEPTVMFTKWQSCLAGPVTQVELPDGGHTDWEVELVVVIGRRAFRIAEGDAWDYVAGLTAGQDISERILQSAGPSPQFSLAKSLPGFGPTRCRRAAPATSSSPSPRCWPRCPGGCPCCRATSCSPAPLLVSGWAAPLRCGWPRATSWSATSPASANCGSGSSPRPALSQRSRPARARPPR